MPKSAREIYAPVGKMPQELVALARDSPSQRVKVKVILALLAASPAGVKVGTLHWRERRVHFSRQAASAIFRTHAIRVRTVSPITLTTNVSILNKFLELRGLPYAVWSSGRCGNPHNIRGRRQVADFTIGLVDKRVPLAPPQEAAAEETRQAM